MSPWFPIPTRKEWFMQRAYCFENYNKLTNFCRYNYVGNQAGRVWNGVKKVQRYPKMIVLL